MYANLLGDKAVTLHIGGPKTREEMTAKIVKDAATWAEYGYGRMVIELKDFGKSIGMCGVWKSSIEDLHFDEIGYAIFQEYWGKGYTTEAIIALTKFAHESAGLRVLNAVVSPENIPSKKVLEKSGYHFARHIDRLTWKNAEFWQKSV